MAKPKLKRIADQVVVVTGASSGIGLATARLAAHSGARVVLSSRNQEELNHVADELRREGAQVLAVAADVADPAAMERLADEAVARFGRIDTWVNNAGLGLFGKLTDTPLADKRKLFDINFWGVVHGCRSAVRRMRASGGALINIGSVVSERAIPVQGMYAASKHAVKGYTDALRMELERDGVPLSVTLVKPTSIATPFAEHARNLTDQAAALPPPAYDPQVVARAIVACAEKPVREIFVGGSSLSFRWLEFLMPRVTDAIMEKTMVQAQKQPGAPNREGSLYQPPSHEGQERGDIGTKMILRSSAYTSAALHPLRTTLVAAGLAALAVGGIVMAANGKKLLPL